MPHRYRTNGYKPHPATPISEGGIGFAEYGRLEQRVLGVESALTNVIGAMDRDRAHVDQQFQNHRLHVDQQFSTLQTTIAERSKIPWPALGVMLSAIVVIGGMAYLPIKEKQSDQALAIVALQGSIVPRTEHVERWRITERDIERLNDRITDNFKAIVPRGEHEEKWRSYTSAQGEFQRQIDEIRKGFGETYSLRDALRTMQERLDRIETGRLTEAGNGKGSGR